MSPVFKRKKIRRHEKGKREKRRPREGGGREKNRRKGPSRQNKRTDPAICKVEVFDSILDLGGEAAAISITRKKSLEGGGGGKRIPPACDKGGGHSGREDHLHITFLYREFIRSAMKRRGGRKRKPSLPCRGGKKGREHPPPYSCPGGKTRPCTA